MSAWVWMEDRGADSDWRGISLPGNRSFQASPEALYVFAYAAKGCASLQGREDQKQRPE
jgi:hypothetical protein